jgi:urea transport system substrate-binding protein
VAVGGLKCSLHTSRSAPRPTVEIGLLVPLHGSAGIFGPSCESCARLAAEEINAAGGLLGRELRLRVVDGSGPPERAAAMTARLVDTGVVDAVVGWHISAVRRAVAPRIASRVPYIYTALYEGGEHTPGVFLVGETPEAQLEPAMRWLAQERGARRWCIVGNDYVWPRTTAALAQRYAQRIDGEVCEEMFVPLDTEHYAPVIGRVLASAADAVLMLLVGQDAARFNRSFADVGLDDQCLRLSTLVDENTLLASGSEGTRGLCSSAAYFETLATPESLAFEARYVARYGPAAPALNSPGESCYEGLLLLAALAEAAGSLDVRALSLAASKVEYSGPRGALHLRDRHLQQRVYLAEADGLEFDVLAQL